MRNGVNTAVYQTYRSDLSKMGLFALVSSTISTPPIKILSPHFFSSFLLILIKNITNR